MATVSVAEIFREAWGRGTLALGAADRLGVVLHGPAVCGALRAWVAAASVGVAAAALVAEAEVECEAAECAVVAVDGS